MKTILAYGDSLTFGYDAASGGRHSYEDRWPGALEAGLAGQARVIAEGLGGRTTVFDDHMIDADRNGARILPTLLASHQPLDAVVIMLGTNDLKPFVCGQADAIARGMTRLAQIVRHYAYEFGATPKLLVVSPPHCGPSDLPGGLPAMQRSVAESQKLAALYQQVANDNGAAFFDAAMVAQPVRVDGAHLDAANTRAIGVALVPVLTKILEL